MPDTRARAKEVGGIWLPAAEAHLAEMLLNHSKTGPVDGKATYQLHKLRAALAHQPGDRRRVAVDVGAHVGLWSMHLVRAFAQVHAFEPVPAHAELLARNVAAENLTLHRVALGARAGRVSIEVPEETTGNGHVLQGQTAPRIPAVPHPERREVWHGVPLSTLDSFELSCVDFIKIDVEGYELPVCRGAERTLRRCRPNVVLEQKGNELAYGEPRDAALGYLKGLGMTPLRAPISGDWVMGWPC